MTLDTLLLFTLDGAMEAILNEEGGIQNTDNAILLQLLLPDRCQVDRQFALQLDFRPQISIKIDNSVLQHRTVIMWKGKPLHMTAALSPSLVTTDQYLYLRSNFSWFPAGWRGGPRCRPQQWLQAAEPRAALRPGGRDHFYSDLQRPNYSEKSSGQPQRP